MIYWVMTWTSHLMSQLHKLMILVNFKKQLFRKIHFEICKEKQRFPFFRIQPAVCPTAPPPPPSSSITFDPFESLEPHTTNLFQPTLFPSHQPQKPIFNAPMVQQQTFMQPPVQTKANVSLKILRNSNSSLFFF